MAAKTAVHNLSSDIAAKIEAIKRDAAEGLRRHDDLIRAKSDEMDKLQKSVTVADAAQLIAKDLRSSINEWREKFARSAGCAAFLGSHEAFSRVTGVSGAGEMVIEERNPSPLRVIPFDASAIAALAILMTDEQIDTWAHAQAVAAGCPKAGRSVAELKAEHDRLLSELQVLDAERTEARKALDKLIDIALHPLLPERVPATPIYADEPAPTVTEVLPDGTRRPQNGTVGHSYEELMRMRAAADAADSRARIAAGDEWPDDHGDALRAMGAQR